MSTPDVSSDTRTRLIEAALDHFGHSGFDGANVRAIARDAGANVAAINYHFGGKQALYRAVAAYIVERIRDAAWPAGAPPRPEMTRVLSKDEARAALHAMIDRTGRTLLESKQAERWARYIVREQLEPTDAFDILYDGVLGQVYGTVTALVARLLDLDPKSSEARLEMFALMGQPLVFRIGRAAVLRQMGWKDVGSRKADVILEQLHRSIDRLGRAP
ncbi:MAG: CerR family C-terminal domain-containing protein [Hyphomicrobiales bacterium]